jgi:telomerase protein component 1
LVSTKSCIRISIADPAFIPKLAIYVRDELGIRTTACYLLALAAALPACQPHLRRFFAAAVNLPSDWLDVAAQYMALPPALRGALTGLALPACLRKALVDKFGDFDSYQLGKYNKERTVKRKARRKREFLALFPTHDFPPDAKPTLTLKRMIRLLHITAPVEPVMCLLGRKYPATHAEFVRSGLRGEWDTARAGQRMKLPVPETWETLVSAKGNRASTWEELIEHKKLPFMAMLRNIRNLLLCGVQTKYHRWVQGKLRDEQTIMHSRQFPFRFFSAYEVVPRDMAHYQQLLDDANDVKNPLKKGAKLRFKPHVMPTDAIFQAYRDALDDAVKLATKHNVEPIAGTTAIFVCVSEAMQRDSGQTGMGGKAGKLDEIGVLLALMCRHACEDSDLAVYAAAPTKAGEPSFVLVPSQRDGGDSILANIQPTIDLRAQLPRAAAPGQPPFFPTDYLEACVRDGRHIDTLIVLSGEPVSGAQARGARGDSLADALRTYRAEVNSDLLFVSVDLSAKGGGVADGSVDGGELTPNDVMIAGFSDAILRFVAQRGDSTQTQHVDNIGRSRSTLSKAATRAAKLNGTAPGAGAGDAGLALALNSVYNAAHEDDPDVRKTKAARTADVFNDDGAVLSAPASAQTRAERAQRQHAEQCAWREARVFLSSTFIDMQGERDALTHVVFPELRRRAAALRVRVTEIDLRWGVTAAEAEHGSTVATCLREIDRCRPFFVGLLGARYGYCPAQYVESRASVGVGERARAIADDEEHFAWLRDYPAGRSITELEIEHAVLREPGAARAAFYLRDERFMHDVPAAVQASFAPADRDSYAKMRELKERVRAASAAHPDRVRLLDQYRCAFKPSADGVPRVTELDAFAARVTDDLWRAIQAEFPAPVSVPRAVLLAASVQGAEQSAHLAALERYGRALVGRHAELEAIRRFARSPVDALLLVNGDAGVGKSAVLATWAIEQRRARELQTKPIVGIAAPPRETVVLYHCVGVTSASRAVDELVRRLCAELLLYFPHFEIETGDDDADAIVRAESSGALGHLSKASLLPSDFSALLVAFNSLMRQAALVARVFVVIDGAERMRDTNRAHTLDWLPLDAGKSDAANAPIAVKWLVGALTGAAAADAALKRGARPLAVGKLDENARSRLVVSTLARHAKRLDASALNTQLRTLVRKRDSHSPLYLLLACEELRVFGVFERLSERIARLAASTPELIQESLARLESASSNPRLAREALCALALARNGLVEAELCAALRMPLAVWAPLRNALASYLASADLSASSRGSSAHPLAYFCAELRNAVLERYKAPLPADEQPVLAAGSKKRGVAASSSSSLGGDDAGAAADAVVPAAVHGKLADEFYARYRAGSGSGSERRVEALARAVRELPYHLCEAGRAEEAAALLSDLEFIESKCDSGAAADLLDDFGRTYRALMGSGLARRTPQQLEQASNMQAMSQWARTQLHVLVREPALAFQLAANAPRDSAPYAAASRWWQTRAAGSARLPTWMRWVNAPQAVPPQRGVVQLPTSALALAVHASADAAPASASSASARRRGAAASEASASFAAGAGALIAVALRDCTVRVYKGDTGDEVAVLEGHGNWVVSLVFSRDGRRLATASWDNTARVWDAALGVSEATFKGHSRRLTSIRWSYRDNALLASSASDGTIRVLDVDQGIERHALSCGAPVSDCQFSIDDSLLVGALWTGQVIVFSTYEKTMLRRVDVTSDGVSLQRIAFRPNGKHLAVLDARGRVAVIAVTPTHGTKAGAGVLMPSTVRASTSVAIGAGVRGTTAAFDGAVADTGAVYGGGSAADDQRLLLASDATGSIVVHSASAGVPRASWPDAIDVADQPELDLKSLQLTCVAIKSDTTLAVVGDSNGRALLLDVATRVVQTELPRHARRITAVAVAGELVGVASSDGLVRAFSLKTGALLDGVTDGERVAEVAQALGATVHALAFTPDQASLLCASDAAALLVYDTKRFGATPVAVRRFAHDAPVRAVAAAANGHVCATGSNDGYVHVWRLSSGEALWRAHAHRDWLHAVEFSADSKRVVTASADNTLCVWTVGGGGAGGATSTEAPKPLCETRGHTGNVLGVTWVGKDRVATASADGTARLFCATTGAELTATRPHNGQPVLEIALSDASTGCVATVGGDGQLCITDMLALRAVLHVRHGRDTRAAFVRSDGLQDDAGAAAQAREAGALVATCARSDAQVRLWQVPLVADAYSLAGRHAAREMARVRVHEGAVRAVAVHPSAERVASVGADGNVCIVTVDGSRPNVVFRHVRVAASSDPAGVRSCAWNADGSLLASGGDDGYVRLFRLTGRRVVVDQQFAPPVDRRTHQRHAIAGVAILADGTTCAASWSGSVFAFEGKKVRELPLDDGWCVAMAAAGRLLAVATKSGVRLVKVPTGAQALSLVATIAIAGGVRGVALAHDGTELVIACADGHVRAVTLNSGTHQPAGELTSLGTHTGRINACALSPGNTRVLSAGEDGRLSLWSVRRGARIAAFDGHGAPLTTVFAAARGGVVALGDAHGGVAMLAVVSPPKSN